MTRRIPATGLAGLVSMLLLSGAFAADGPTITRDVVYGHKDGLAMTFDVIAPEQANGAGILWIQSGGWYSIYNEPEKLLPACQFLLNEGYTVLIVRHGSSPRYAVPDAVADVRRCVRYVRLHGEEFGLDPERLGAYGGSAGGHLTLMLALTGDDGDPNHEDPVLQTSSRIAAGVSLFPPTDLRGWTTDPPAAIKALPQLQPSIDFDTSLEESVSPVAHVTPDDAPVLIIHGDQDQLVPISHSHNIMPLLEKAGVESELITVEGAGHGYSREQSQTIVVPAFLRWFEKHLAATPSE